MDDTGDIFESYDVYSTVCPTCGVLQDGNDWPPRPNEKFTCCICKHEYTSEDIVEDGNQYPFYTFSTIEYLRNNCRHYNDGKCTVDNNICRHKYRYTASSDCLAYRRRSDVNGNNNCTQTSSES